MDVSKWSVIYAGAQKNLGPAGTALVLLREDLMGHAMDKASDIGMTVHREPATREPRWALSLPRRTVSEADPVLAEALAGVTVNAARALGLDFIPVVTEQYDLVIPQAYFESSSVQVLLEAIGSAEFRKQVESLGGYSTQRTGELLL